MSTQECPDATKQVRFSGSVTISVQVPAGDV